MIKIWKKILKPLLKLEQGIIDIIKDKIFPLKIHKMKIKKKQINKNKIYKAVLIRIKSILKKWKRFCN